MMGDYQTICRTGDIPEGSGRTFSVGSAMIGVFHVGGHFYALDDRCPHAGASLARGTIADERVVRCRIHHWGFCLGSGEYVDEEKPNCNARTLPVRVVGEDVQVWVETPDT
jgi:nitrite reductase (NADH) small subunit/3-phenylpropionate/trans-cinnamate dioxygenase ferredoxin subunit